MPQSIGMIDIGFSIEFFTYNSIVIYYGGIFKRVLFAIICRSAEYFALWERFVSNHSYAEGSFVPFCGYRSMSLLQPIDISEHIKKEKD